MRKLIDLGEGDITSRRTHLNNLDQMVKYCEDMNECRRVLQLQVGQGQLITKVNYDL